MDRRVFLRLCALTAVGVTVAGCSPTAPKPPVEAAVGAAVDPPRITLISAGTSPRTALRFADIATDGSDRTVAVTTGFSQRVFPSADAVDPHRPTVTDVTTTATLTCSTVAAENSPQATRSIFLEVTTSTSGDATAAQELSGADGFGFGMFATDTGSISSVNYSAPEGASAQARVRMERYLGNFFGFPLVFPTEDIGVGAQWTVENRTATFLQEITYTLAAFDPATGTGTVTGTVTQRPSVSVLDTSAITGAPANLSVVASDGGSTLSLDFDLTTALPTTGTVEVTTRIQYGTDDSPLRVVEDHFTRVDYQQA